MRSVWIQLYLKINDMSEVHNEVILLVPKRGYSL